MAIYYIDTSSLKWRYISGRPTSVVDQLLESATDHVITSELTILEWSSALASVYRNHIIDRRAFKRNEIALMTDIYQEKLEIYPLAPRTIEKARYLIEYIGVEQGLSLRTGDSIQLISAFNFASYMTSKVFFITSDRKLSNIVDKVDVVSQQLTANFLNPI